MNGTQLKCLLAMTVLALTGFGPLSLTCLIGMFVLIRRPIWFFQVVQNLYDNHRAQAVDLPPRNNGTSATVARIKSFLSLLTLLILDIAPVPVTGSIGLYVVTTRPKWFKTLVERIYNGAVTSSR
ncbi:MAG: hypothetical protein ACPW60_13245 [Methylohalobius sp. ZOD2]